MVVLPECCCRAYNSSEVENDPEDRNVLGLVPFCWVCQHKGTLGGPQQSCADTEDSPSRNGEGFGSMSVVNVKNPGRRLMFQEIMGDEQRTKSRQCTGHSFRRVRPKVNIKMVNFAPQGANLEGESGTEHVVHGTSEL